MAKYVVTAVGGISLHTVVEAESPGDARKIAVADRSPTGLCYGAETGTVDDAWMTSGELDCDIGDEDIVAVEQLERKI